MNSSSNLLVLGVTGQVGRLVAKHLKRSKANFSVGSRRKANLEELADQFGASRFIDLDDPRTFDEALKKDRKSTRLNSSHLVISYAVFCLKKKTYATDTITMHRQTTSTVLNLASNPL